MFAPANSRPRVPTPTGPRSASGSTASLHRVSSHGHLVLADRASRDVGDGDRSDRRERRRIARRASAMALAGGASAAARPRPIPLGKRPQGMRLERAFGCTATEPGAVAVHPDPAAALVAYAAGAVVVLYHHRKNRQIRYLVPPSVDPAGTARQGSLGTSSSTSATAATTKAAAAGAGGHSNAPVTALAFAPCGRYLAAGSGGATPSITVWNLQTDQVLVCLAAHRYGVRQLAFLGGPGPQHPSRVSAVQARYLVSLGTTHDRLLCVWDWALSRRLAATRLEKGVMALAVLPPAAPPIANEPLQFATGGRVHCKLWQFHPASAAAAAGSPTSPPASGAAANDAALGAGLTCVDVQLGDLYHADISGLCWNRPSTAIYADPAPPELYAVTRSGILLLMLEGRLDRWVDLASPRGGTVAALGDGHVACGLADGMIRVFQAGTLVYQYSFPRPPPLTSAYATVPSTQRPRSPSCASPPPASALAAAAAAAPFGFPDTRALAFSRGTNPRRMLAVAVYADATVILWDVTQPTHIGKYRTLSHHARSVYGVAAMTPRPGELRAGGATGGAHGHGHGHGAGPNGAVPSRFISWSLDGTLRFWRPCLTLPTQATAAAAALTTTSATTVSPSSAAAAAAETELHRRRSFFSQELSDVVSIASELRSGTLTADGEMAIVGDRDGTVHFVTCRGDETPTVTGSVVAQQGEITAIAASTQHAYFATGGRDRAVHVYGFDGQRLQTLEHHSATITHLHFCEVFQETAPASASPSASGSAAGSTASLPTAKTAVDLLISAAADKSVAIMTAVQGRFVTQSHVVHRASLADLAVVDDVLWLVLSDRTVLAYALGAQQTTKLAQPSVAIRSPAVPTRVAVDRTGSLMVVASADKRLRLIALHDGTCLATMAGPSEPIMALQLLATPGRFAVAAADGCVYVYRWSRTHDPSPRPRPPGSPVAGLTSIASGGSLPAAAAAAALLRRSLDRPLDSAASMTQHIVHRPRSTSTPAVAVAVAVAAETRARDGHRPASLDGEPPASLAYRDAEAGPTCGALAPSAPIAVVSETGVAQFLDRGDAAAWKPAWLTKHVPTIMSPLRSETPLMATTLVGVELDAGMASAASRSPPSSSASASPSASGSVASSTQRRLSRHTLASWQRPEALTLCVHDDTADPDETAEVADRSAVRDMLVGDAGSNAGSDRHPRVRLSSSSTSIGAPSSTASVTSRDDGDGDGDGDHDTDSVDDDATAMTFNDVAPGAPVQLSVIRTAWPSPRTAELYISPSRSPAVTEDGVNAGDTKRPWSGGLTPAETDAPPDLSRVSGGTGGHADDDDDEAAAVVTTPTREEDVAEPGFLTPRDHQSGPEEASPAAWASAPRSRSPHRATAPFRPSAARAADADADAAEAALTTTLTPEESAAAVVAPTAGTVPTPGPAATAPPAARAADAPSEARRILWRERKEATAREVARVRHKLQTLGIAWRLGPTPSTPSTAGGGGGGGDASPSPDGPTPTTLTSPPRPGSPLTQVAEAVVQAAVTAPSDGAAAAATALAALTGTDRSALTAQLAAAREQTRAWAAAFAMLKRDVPLSPDSPDAGSHAALETLLHDHFRELQAALHCSALM
ncbi:hypothetical protein CXG81DRAFT_26020 [Caulochytrium protostelioides]|uniref:WD40 repeat-like protein n=1 Tax=Caulochytrium protostelioides TaxID=1555241 RepID=A0A4P9X7S4_9FUNG|nr:hypothetical protein CXG81DRAFT_26020 [Caulochytrium protostelioides]|eukprot:RKP01306.1 hypothetical protein CXG81DRAFT_26020 [Caulochytrium protostelioides]